jgi:quinol monooxygenase YgiN
MSKSKPVDTLVIYRAKKGKADELQTLVQKHWPTLHRIGLATAEPAKLWKATDKRSGEVSFIEIFQWRDEAASGIAHQTPEVMAIWEPMGPILEDLKINQIEPVASTSEHG